MSAARLWRPAAAILALLWVLAANGGPLVYFDSVSYVDQGRTVWRMVLGDPAPHLAAGGPGEVGRAAGDDGDADTVNLSRSVVFPAALGLFDRLGLQTGFPLAAAGWVALTLWLAARAVWRSLAPPAGSPPVGPKPPLVALPLLVAGFGALPFYVAYLMPDIFAPTLLVAAAVLAAFGRDLRGWELALLGFIALTSIVMHPSHMLIALGLLPVTVVLGLVSGLRRWWIGPLVLGIAAGLGTAERLLVPVAASKVSGAEVVYLPILTARAIIDGPGWTYLAERCPDQEIPACALYEELSKPGDSYRFTASHIVFETSPELGSYRLLDKEAQRKIGETQTRFYLDVVRAYPFGMAWALVKNAWGQARYDSIEMTIASQKVVDSARAAGLLTTSRLTGSRDWIPPVETFHNALYLVSLAGIVLLLFWPGRLSRGIRTFAVVVLLGIGVNALVCGGVSQPANRYGARVIWLLPWLAALLALLVARGRAARN